MSKVHGMDIFGAVIIVLFYTGVLCGIIMIAKNEKNNHDADNVNNIKYRVIYSDGNVYQVDANFDNVADYTEFQKQMEQEIYEMERSIREAETELERSMREMEFYMYEKQR